MKMLTYQIKYSQFILFLSLTAIISCNSVDKKEQITSEEKTDTTLIDSVKVENDKSLSKNTAKVDTTLIDSTKAKPDRILPKDPNALEVLVLPNANSYNYMSEGYFINKHIGKELNKLTSIKVKPFPFGALRGVTYLGVFDKRYCLPIVRRVNVDFLILSRFDTDFPPKGNQKKWGYQLRIVNAKTLQQINTINAHALNTYSDVEKHIRSNIEKLKTDIEKFKSR
ncbi:hypothetical protein BKI52_30045 [marine bacterium AO1-C]|nr:hypothetical protein BKI52_30045 [marine bacterium AO1-C]